MNLVFLKKSILDSEKFKAGGPDSKPSFDGFALLRVQDRVATSLSKGLRTIIPQDLQQYVDYAEYTDSFPAMVRRIRGRYRLGDIEAEVEMVGAGTQSPTYRVDLKGGDLEAMRALLYRIKAGTILPFENWDVPQMPAMTYMAAGRDVYPSLGGWAKVDAGIRVAIGSDGNFYVARPYATTEKLELSDSERQHLALHAEDEEELEEAREFVRELVQSRLTGGSADDDDEEPDDEADEDYEDPDDEFEDYEDEDADDDEGLDPYL